MVARITPTTTTKASKKFGEPMDLHHLTHPGSSWLHLLVSTPAKGEEALRAAERTAAGRVTVRTVRGRLSETTSALLQECAAAVQFPLTFGENWDAAYDCLTDLAWLCSAGLILYIPDARRLLTRSPAEEHSRLQLVLSKAADFWRHPVSPHSPRAFHVVLQAAEADEAGLLNHWQAAGATAHRLR
jgi:hypothetical protein